ncbi:MAG: phosphate ABC transporter substrate-binding protein PstS [Actinomycetota bacterium]
MNLASMTRRRSGVLITAVVLALALTTAVGPACDAPAFVDGGGSTWSQIAVDQWRADVARQGVTINYQGVGSTAGRVAYYQGQVDFAVSEIPFQDGSTGTTDEIALARKRPWVYLPIVAGGTSFMYHLDVNGSRVTDLRLSPRTIARIFTGEIKNWNDPDITRDNRGKAFPSLPMKPVIRSDGSGTSAQFTLFMSAQVPDVWQRFCALASLGAGCPATSTYPNPPGVGFAAQQFSDGVANFVAAPYNNGSITYVEYGYAKERGYPVASVLNKAGYYTQPTAQAVAIALQGARINPDGTQILGGVYNFPDNRAYPVSSYSYMIAPTAEAAPFTRAKGDPLGRYILYFLCAGQQKAEQLGYSPLPKNLVQLGFDAVRKIPGAPAPPPITSCSNPTITGDFITGAAPPPDPDDGGGGTTGGGTTGGGTTGGSTSGGGTSGGGTSGGSTTGGGTTGGGTTGGGNGLGGGPTGGLGGGGNGSALATSGVVELPSGRQPVPFLVSVGVVLALLALVFGPAAVLTLRRRRTSQ